LVSWWQDEKSFAIKNTNSRIKILMLKECRANKNVFVAYKLLYRHFLSFHLNRHLEIDQEVFHKDGERSSILRCL